MALANKISLRESVSGYVLTLKAVWLRWAIVLGVLGMAAAIGLVVAKRNPLYAVIAALAPLGLYLFQQALPRRNLVPVIILGTALFVPLSLPTGTGSRLVFSLVLTTLFVGLWILRSWVIEKRFRLVPTPVNIPLLGFMLVVLISLVWGNLFRDPLVAIWNSFPFVQSASALVMIMLPGAFLLVVNYVQDLKMLKVMVGVMLAAGAVGLIRQYGLAYVPVNTGGMFGLWVISLAVGLALFARQLRWRYRALLLALAGAWVYWGFVLHIEWLAGWLPAFVAGAVLCLQRSKKLLFVLVISMAILILMRADYYLGSVIGAEAQQSGESRLWAWRLNWIVTREHWLFGTGPAGYAVYYMSYFPSYAMATHNNYVDILSQTGVISMAMLLWFFGALAWSGYRLCQRLKGRGDFVEALANVAFAGTIACVVIMAFGDWLFPFAYTQSIAGFDYAVYNWLFMGTLLALDRVTRPASGAATHA